MYTQIVSSLERRLEGEPKQSKDFLDLADIAIVCGHSDDGTLRPKFDQAIRQLLSSDSPRWKNLGQVISTIYAKDSISKDQFNNFKHTLEGNLPVGWYRTQACMRLLLISGQTAAYNHVKEENYTNMLAFSQRVITLLMIMSTAALTGIITILVFFATETRKGNTPPYSTVPWSFTTTYGVTVGWLATQLVMQLVVLGSAKQGLKHILHAGSAATAILTVVIYVITTGPALLYIWWFACRPFNLRFLDAIGLHLSNASANFFKLTVRGVLTWCAAIPVVLGSQLLAMKLFSSQGSSNPVLTLVRDVAHSPSIVPVIIYFIILGILAPFVEETLFRGFLYSSLRTKLGRYLSAAISAALFAIAHFDPGASISLFALGFLFALVRERYQSILPSIVGHGMWNCGTFLLVLVLFGN
jgi:membrane protease YdiL (CAAX protease family)